MGVDGQKLHTLFEDVPVYGSNYEEETKDGTGGVTKFGSYNIQNGRNGGLESALCGMAQANIDMGVLLETKLTNGVYTWGRTDIASSP